MMDVNIEMIYNKIYSGVSHKVTPEATLSPSSNIPLGGLFYL
jgi:hypothetical protein